MDVFDEVKLAKIKSLFAFFMPEFVLINLNKNSFLSLIHFSQIQETKMTISRVLLKYNLRQSWISASFKQN